MTKKTAKATRVRDLTKKLKLLRTAVELVEDRIEARLDQHTADLAIFAEQMQPAALCEDQAEELPKPN